MAEKKEAAAAQQQNQQLQLSLSNRVIPTSYANAFQVSVVDGSILITFGLSRPSVAKDKDGKDSPAVSLEFEQRVVVPAQAAVSMAQSVLNTVAPKKPAAKKAAAEKK
ncbi:MAG: hypothetical protein IJ228_06610 [Succinivibrio sp.]|nr:hypothetical protein [Succinivibrio sp.]